MNTRKLTLLFTALVGLAVSAFAQTKTTEATVARVTGAATVTLPDGSTQPLTAGMKVSQGSTITTGSDGDLYLESHTGYVTSIKKDSVVEVNEISVTSAGGKVTEERTILDLKSGNLVAKLDPSKKAVNRYAVRTPKGVAAARGTVFTMSYKGAKVTISVVDGVVSVVAPGLFNANFGGGDQDATGTTTGASEWGASGNTVNAGQTLSQDADNLANILPFGELGTYAAYNAQENVDEANSIKELLSLAVATVAVAAQNGIGGTTVAEAAAVAKAVFAAVPSAAAQTAALMKASGVTNTAVTNAVKNEVPPSEAANFNSSLSSGTFSQDTLTKTGAENDNQTVQTTTTTKPTPIDASTISRSN